MAMSLPELASFPPTEVLKSISRDEWKICLDGWILLLQKYLSVPRDTFAASVTETSSLVEFLHTYIASSSEHRGNLSHESSSLHKKYFLVIHRILSEIDEPPASLLNWKYLSSLSLAYAKSKILQDLLDTAWLRLGLTKSIPIQKTKNDLILALEEPNSISNLELQVLQTTAFAHACKEYGRFLMAGADFIDSVVMAYNKNVSMKLKERLVLLAHVCLSSLINFKTLSISVLLDHLYSLKATPLLQAVLEKTSFLRLFEHYVSNRKEDSRRAKPLLEDFSKFRGPSRRKTAIKRKIDKGKHRAVYDYDDGKASGAHIHKVSLVTQIQDLFPDLGSGFIIKLLDEYGDDTELVTSHLLEDDLPLHLKEADRTEAFDISNSAQLDDNAHPTANLAPHSTPPLLPIRRNIYDNDEFDNLAIDTSKLHIGRKNKDLTADEMLATDRSTNQKAAILSALATFDSDDDERDDTYDVEDVGGTIDTTFGDEDEDKASSDKSEEILYRAYKTSPDIFKRDAQTRKSQSRSALRHETGMTDEAIEGWAIMLARDPGRHRRLERTYELSTGSQQSILQSTAWRADSGTEGAADDSDIAGTGAESGGDVRGGKGRGRGRGRGRGGGRGGAVSGPANGRDTQLARQRKDANKGSRANHNRRDQRARKMARGGFPT